MPRTRLTGNPPHADSKAPSASEGVPSPQESARLKKEFLSLYCDSEREIARLEEEIMRWQSRAEKMTGSFSHLPRHTGGSNSMQCAIDELVELRAMLYDRLTDATELRLSIAAAIAQVSEPRLRLLLEYRYIDGLTWERVAAALTCDYRWTLRLHERAIAALPQPKPPARTKKYRTH